MYERLRNELALGLCNNFNSQEIDMILHNLDAVMINYDVSDKSTALEVCLDALPREAELYLRTLLLEGKSSRTEKLYRIRLKGFFEVVRKSIYSITTNDIRNFLITYQMQHDIKDVTLEKYRQIINVFFEWCVREDYIAKNPCTNIKKIKYEDNTRKALTRFELERLRRACKTLKERAIIETLYSTGCRVTELINMKKSDINYNEKSIEVLGKGKRKYTVYFNEVSQIALNEYIDNRTDDSDWLFVSDYKPYNQMSIDSVECIFRKLSKRLGFYVCPHIMRHTFATMILQAGAPIDVVQKALNHKSVATTQRYAETSDDSVVAAHRKYVV